MDANGTRLHLMLGYEDWSACSEVPSAPRNDAGASPPNGAWIDLAWDCGRDELTLRPRLTLFAAAPNDRRPKLDDRRGAGRDRFGNWYWIDPSGLEIRVHSKGTGKTTHFWSAVDVLDCPQDEATGAFRSVAPRTIPQPLPLSGLAVTEDHYLVVGVPEPAGILIFDLHAGGPPQQMYWPEGIPFTPFDMAPAPGGGVWILDRVHARYWKLDRHLQVIRVDQEETILQSEKALDFQPLLGGTVQHQLKKTFPQGLTLAAASPQLAAIQPIAIEALPDGTVLILDGDTSDKFSRIYRYDLGQEIGLGSTQVMTTLIEVESQSAFRLHAHDFAFVPEHQADGSTVPDRLYIADSEGNQVYAFEISQEVGGALTLQPQRDYLPMRLFGGKGLVSAGNQAYYDFGDGWIPLVAQRRPRYSEEATFVTPCDPTLPIGPTGDSVKYRPAFDGREPDCVWHRLLLDACIPPETSVTIWSRAANEQRDLPLVAWQVEPRPYLRGDGSELPFVRKPPAATGRGTWELLLQNARGRYLQLKVQLSGNGRSTPRLRAMRIYYPRFSYLDHYLPAVYREDQPSASFLDRFLANVEGFDTALEDKIAAVQLLFDVRSAPPETLAWLASWFGVALDPGWNENARRLFIRHAMCFFQNRGTMRGLQMALRLVHDACASEAIFGDPFGSDGRPHPIRIVENFRTRRTPGVALGDPTAAVQLRPAESRQRWFPRDGGAALHQQYRTSQAPAKDRERDAPTEFPLTAPSVSPEDWRTFALSTLGFVPAARGTDLPRWQKFLARRYHRVRSLNDLYRTNWLAFEEVPLPDRLPSNGAPLQDWYQFESVVLAMQRSAHRFSVLLPAPVQDTPDRAEHRRRMDLTRRVIELEKPAHTVFDVKFYWAFFRIGEVRLGADTVLDLGSRDPRLLPAMILGQGYLAESFLAPGHPQNVMDRQIVGRDAPVN